MQTDAETNVIVLMSIIQERQQKIERQTKRSKVRVRKKERAKGSE